MKIQPYISFDIEITVDFNAAPLPAEVVKHHTEGFTLIAAWRIYRGLSQRDVAIRAGIPEQTYSRQDRGVHKPMKHTLQKIAYVLGVRVEQLVE